MNIDLKNVIEIRTTSTRVRIENDESTRTARIRDCLPLEILCLSSYVHLRTYTSCVSRTLQPFFHFFTYTHTYTHSSLSVHTETNLDPSTIQGLRNVWILDAQDFSIIVTLTTFFALISPFFPVNRLPQYRLSAFCIVELISATKDSLVCLREGRGEIGGARKSYPFPIAQSQKTIQILHFPPILEANPEGYFVLRGSTSPFPV